MGAISAKYERCEDIITGPNCDVSWYEELSVAVVFVFQTLSAFYGVLFLLFSGLLIENYKRGKQNSEDAKRQGFIVRRSVVLSCTCTTAFFMFFSGFGMGMKYSVDFWKGKVSMIGLLIALSWTAESVKSVFLMYLLSTNNLLRKSGFLDMLLEAGVTKTLVNPWYIHAITVITTILILVDYDPVIEDRLIVLRLAFGGQLIHLTVAGSGLIFYLFKMAKQLDAVVDLESTDGNKTKSNYAEQFKRWKTLAFRTRLLAYFAASNSPVIIAFMFVLLTTPILKNPYVYLAFFACVCFPLAIMYALLFNLLRPNGFFQYSSSGKEKTRILSEAGDTETQSMATSL